MKIDAHHHVWNLSSRPQAWMTPEQRIGIGRDFTLDDWVDSARSAGVTHSIVVQTVDDPEETPELLDLAAATPSLLGVVGWVDIDQGSVDAQLDSLLAHPAGRFLVSVRDLTQYRADHDWLAGDHAGAACAAAAARGLAVDLLITGATLPAATRAVAAQPGTRFVVNHLAKPDLDTLPPAAWAATMRQLATRPNVAIKLSGVATLTRDLATAGPRLAQYVDTTLELFGADRVMFGSDWPVSQLGAGYGALVDALQTCTRELSTTEQEQIWGGTAQTWYRLTEEEVRP